MSSSDTKEMCDLLKEEKELQGEYRNISMNLLSIREEVSKMKYQKQLLMTSISSNNIKKECLIQQYQRLIKDLEEQRKDDTRRQIEFSCMINQADILKYRMNSEAAEAYVFTTIVLLNIGCQLSSQQTNLQYDDSALYTQKGGVSQAVSHNKIMDPENITEERKEITTEISLKKEIEHLQKRKKLLEKQTEKNNETFCKLKSEIKELLNKLENIMRV